jgi:hypothetical protein
MCLFNKTVMHTTTIPKATGFGLRADHNQTYALLETC